jgi:hypothetical protein
VRSFNDILFGSSSNCVDVIETIEPANSGGIRPVQSNQLESRGDHLIPMAVESSVY